MSLKHDIAEYPEMWSKEIVAALDDYKNGKWNSKRKLRKFVNREISEHYYNELIERYAFFHRTNQAKRERERSRKIKRVLCIVVSIVTMFFSGLCTLVYLVEEYGEGIAFWYVLLSLFSFSYITSASSEEDEKKISRLVTENELLKDSLETYKNSNEELKAELENKRKN